MSCSIVEWTLVSSMRTSLAVVWPSVRSLCCAARLGSRAKRRLRQRLGGERCGLRSPEVEALGAVAAEVLDDALLGVALDPFGDELEAQRLAEADDALEQREVVLA